MRKADIILILSLLLLALAIVMAATIGLSEAGPFLISHLALMAIYFQTKKDLKTFTYTIVIFTAVAAALYYPQYFTTWNNFSLSLLITPFIQLIMFGMGASMAFADFTAVVKMPKGVFIGVTSHFIIMPLLGYVLARWSGLHVEIAAGIILLGCSPNGLASNVISYLAKANVALSITITAVSTLLAPFLMPMLMKLLANSFIEINATHMMWDIFKMVIIPIVAGLLFNHFLKGKFKWLDASLPFVSMTGIVFSIVVIVAAGRDSLLNIGPLLLGLLLIHNLLGYLLGYWFARFFNMSERDCRTVAIEVGMQNAGLATGIAKSMGKIATIGLAPAVFGSLMNITGSVLASWWHKRDPSPDKEAATEHVKIIRIQEQAF